MTLPYLLNLGMFGTATAPTIATNFPDPLNATASPRVDPLGATVAARVDPMAATVGYRQATS